MPPLEWKTLEYSEKNRGSDWFWAVGIILISVAVSSVILDNLLFAVFIVIAGIALILQVIRKPDEITVRIDERGVDIDGTLYLYQALEAFWIEHLGDNDFQLLLRSKKLLVPYIVVHIEGVSVQELRDYISHYIEEEEMHEPLSQKIMDRLGF